MDYKNFLRRIVDEVVGPEDFDTLALSIRHVRSMMIDAGIVELVSLDNDGTVGTKRVEATNAFQQMLKYESRMLGKIRFFDEKKEYGFVKPDDGGDDVFLHKNNVVGIPLEKLQPDTPVSFTLEKSKKGLRIVSIMLLETAAAA